jgi:hypothetical protein
MSTGQPTSNTSQRIIAGIRRNRNPSGRPKPTLGLFAARFFPWKRSNSLHHRLMGTV